MEMKNKIPPIFIFAILQPQLKATKISNSFIMNIKTIILTIVLAAICTTGYAQNTTNPADSIKVVLLENLETNTYDTVYIVAEEMPEYSGGDMEMRKFLAMNVQYPKEARNKNIQGKVIVYYVVNEKGGIENVFVSESVDPLLDAEAIRVVKKLPKPFKPGKVQGKPVKVLLTVPINFMVN